MKDTLGELKDKSKELADTKVELAKVQQWCDTHKDNHENTKEEATALEKENKKLKDELDKAVNDSAEGRAPSRHSRR